MSKLEPPPLPAEKPKSSGLSVVGAGCLGMMIVLGGAIMMLAALGGGTPRGLILFGLITLSIFAIHYATWGWWLGPRLRQQEEQQSTVEKTLEKP
jgi:hypothetical protein